MGAPPPPPPGVPDQAPKPPGAAPQPDPWARPEGWRPPVPSRRSTTGSSPGSGGIARWIVLAVAGFLVFGSCLSVLPSVVPDIDPPAGFPYGPSEAPSPARPRIRELRLGATERTAELPARWTWHAASDATFVVAGPQRLDRVRRGPSVAFVFDVEPPLTELRLEVSETRRAEAGRRFLERATARFLGRGGSQEMVDVTTSFRTVGGTVEMRLDGRLGDDVAALRSFVRGGRLFRVWAVGRAGDPQTTEALETFLRSVTVSPAG